MAPELVAQPSELLMTKTLLGKGGFASVYSATYHGQPAAVKCVQGAMTAAEFNASLRVAHPNIIRIKVRPGRSPQACFSTFCVCT